MTKKVGMDPTTSTVRIATFNILNDPELFRERFAAAVLEAEEKSVDFLLFQEVLFGEIRTLNPWLRERGWSFNSIAEYNEFPHRPLTLSRQPSISSGVVHTPPRSYVPGSYRPLPVFREDFPGITIFNGHLPWGQRTEYARLQTAIEVDREAEGIPESQLVVFGGDFNSQPESSTLRFLQGNSAELRESDAVPHSTHWTSCWTSRELFPTARRDGGWAEKTAARRGISRPDLLPERTIDYLLSYGWNFGKRGCPLSLERFGETLLPDGRALSDHWGLLVDFQL